MQLIHTSETLIQNYHQNLNEQRQLTFYNNIPSVNIPISQAISHTVFYMLFLLKPNIYLPYLKILF